MTAIPLSVKLEFFTPDNPSRERICIDCGMEYEVHANWNTRVKRCPTCAMLHHVEMSRNQYQKIDREVCTGYMTVDLVAAVITQAIIDARNGDTDAREFLRAEDGAELYLKLAGVEVDDEMRRRLYWIGKHRIVKHPEGWHKYG